jgi:uncharacterized cupin superfamily protein
MSVEKIEIENKSEGELRKMGVFSWPIWEKEPSTFDWHYDETEQCYILEGQVRVEPKNGTPIEFGPGDFVTFPKGLDCMWKVLKGVRKHYNFL